MKKIILAILFIAFYLNAFSKTWVIRNSGLTFSPTTTTIQNGDSVDFILEISHNALEVSQSVWNANGNSPGIGFSVPFGGGLVLPVRLTIGTHYYVCTPHASFGMKGKIIVQQSAGLNETNKENSILVYPNPVIDRINIQYEFPASTMFEIKLIDIQGNIIKILLTKTEVSGTFFQSFTFPKKIATGVYFVEMSLGKTKIFKKLVIL